MPVFTWSHDAATNATIDTTINLAAGRSPSSITPADRSTLAAIAQWRDDISGGTVTSGTSTAYILNTFSVFDTAAHLSNQMVAFTPHATNGAGPVTMTLDSIANIPLRIAPNTELPEGVIVAGTPYCARFNQADNAFYLHGYFGNIDIPFLTGMDYWDTITPGSQYIFPAGQAISRTVYSRAFARWGTQFGPGDGATTFNVPDKTERVSVMMAAAASRLTAAGFGGNSTVLGATGGAETETLTAAQIPPHVHPNTLTDPEHAHAFPTQGDGGGFPSEAGQGGNNTGASVAATNSAFTGITINNEPNTGGGGAHPNVQPTIVCNYIIRII